jgi:HAD superfamily phosphoserine phosphatase-like hydrolase
MNSYCLISDFDGTFTRREFYELALERYLPGDITHYWTDYAAGRLSHFDALAGIFGEIRCTEAELRALTGEMQPDPRTPEALRAFAAAGWDVVLVSNGCEWYIEQVLARLGVAEAGLAPAVYACPGRFVAGQGLLMERPPRSSWFRAGFGIDKRLLVDELQGRYERVAFAGNGSPDREAALAVAPELRFARGWLARRFTADQIPFQGFDGWAELAGALTGAPSCVPAEAAAEVPSDRSRPRADRA